MNKHRITLIIGIIILIAAILISIFIIPREDEPEPQVDLPAEQVRAFEVRNREIPVSIKITGQLIAEGRIDIFSEAGGILINGTKPFKVGNNFNKGDIIIHINDDEFRQSIIASRSAFLRAITMLMPDIKLDYQENYQTWLKYINDFDVNRPVPNLPEPSSPQERYFLTGRNIYTQYHEIRQMEVRLGKYRIRAPFNGTVTEALITPGSLVIQGQRLGEFIQTGAYELESTVSTNDLRFIQTGDSVKLNSRVSGKTWQGTIARIGEQIEPASQSIRIFVSVKADNLKEGMFLSGEIKAQTFENAETIRREILIRDFQVFTIINGQARLQAVEVLHVADEEVVVRGLQDGDIIINERKSEAFEGREVEGVFD